MQRSEHPLPERKKHLMVRPLAVLEGHTSGVYGLEFSPDGTLLYSIGEPLNHFWQEDQEGNWKLYRTSPGGLLRFLPDNAALLLFSEDLWPEHVELQSSEGECLKTIPCNHLKQRLLCRYSPDHKWFLTYDCEAQLYFWEVESFRFEIGLPLLPPDIRLHCPRLFRFTPDGQQLFFLDSGRICHCQFRSDPPAIIPEGCAFRLGPQWSISDFVISPLGKILAIANEANDCIELHDLSTLQHLKSLPMGDMPVFVVFSPDGNFVAGLRYDSVVCIWNAHTGQLEQTFVSHPGPVMEQSNAIGSITWSPRGDIIAIGGTQEEAKDYSIKLWKITYTGENVRQQSEPGAPV